MIINFQGLVPVEGFNRRGFNAVTFHENVTRPSGADDSLVTREVVGMTVRDEGKGHRAVWIEGETDPWEVKESRIKFQSHGAY
jgi:hypothetical protein